MKIKNKELAFLSLCGDWDYRKNVDMIEPHLQGIAIRDNKILISCEKFSNTADDYVSCIATEIEDKNMINKFKKLNLKNKGEVIDFISNIEKIVDWRKIRVRSLSAIPLPCCSSWEHISSLKVWRRKNLLQQKFQDYLPMLSIHPLDYHTYPKSSIAGE